MSFRYVGQVRECHHDLGGVLFSNTLIKLLTKLTAQTIRLAVATTPLRVCTYSPQPPV